MTQQIESTDTRTVSIDLVSYEVVREGDNWVVNCGGSILSKLQKPSRLWWNERCGSVVGEHFCDITYDAEEESCSFETKSFEDVVQWISDNFYRIEAIEYEALDNLPT